MMKWKELTNQSDYQAKRQWGSIEEGCITIKNSVLTLTVMYFLTFAVKSRTAQQAKMKWVVNIVFYILQVGGNFK